MGKQISDLTPADLKSQPVWRFVQGGKMDVVPLTRLPPSNFDFLVIGTEVQLADGSLIWTLLQNFSLAGPQHNDHLLTLSFDIDGHWFQLARYHDPWLESHGPLQLARRLGKRVEEVFPVNFDLRKILRSDDLVFFGEAKLEPDIKLTRDQIMQMVLG